MTGTTAKGYPYPTGTDRVMDGDNAIQALAQAVDTQLGAMAAGQATTPVPGALSSAVNVTVTFPAGRFATAPLVYVANVTGAPHGQTASVAAAPTATSCTLYASKLAGSLVAMTLNWQAISMA